MAFSATITQNVFGTGLALDGSITVSGTREDRISEAYPAGTVDQLTNFECDVAQMKLIAFLSDVDCTIKTNNAAAPADTIDLRAGEPLVWWDTSYCDNPITANVSAFYVTAAAECNLQVLCLEDATP